MIETMKNSRDFLGCHGRDYSNETLKASNIRGKLEEAGASQAAIEAAIKMTAEARHQWRRDSAIYAALKALHPCLRARENWEPCPCCGCGADSRLDCSCTCENQGSIDTEFTQKHAASAILLLWLDCMGLGGRLGLEGLATDRIPAFSELGKGRKRADDGPAWSAAIRDALDFGLKWWIETYREPLVVRPTKTGWETAGVRVGKMEIVEKPGSSANVGRCELGPEYRPWLIALCRIAQLRLCGVKVRNDLLGRVAIGGSVKEWALLESLLEELEETS